MTISSEVYNGTSFGERRSLLPDLRGGLLRLVGRSQEREHENDIPRIPELDRVVVERINEQFIPRFERAMEAIRISRGEESARTFDRTTSGYWLGFVRGAMYIQARAEGYHNGRIDMIQRPLAMILQPIARRVEAKILGTMQKIGDMPVSEIMHAVGKSVARELEHTDQAKLEAAVTEMTEFGLELGHLEEMFTGIFSSEGMRILNNAALELSVEEIEQLRSDSPEHQATIHALTALFEGITSAFTQEQGATRLITQILTQQYIIELQSEHIALQAETLQVHDEEDTPAINETRAALIQAEADLEHIQLTTVAKARARLGRMIRSSEMAPAQRELFENILDADSENIILRYVHAIGLGDTGVVDGRSALSELIPHLVETLDEAAPRGHRPDVDDMRLFWPRVLATGNFFARTISSINGHLWARRINPLLGHEIAKFISVGEIFMNATLQTIVFAPIFWAFQRYILNYEPFRDATLGHFMLGGLLTSVFFSSNGYSGFLGNSASKHPLFGKFAGILGKTQRYTRKVNGFKSPTWIASLDSESTPRPEETVIILSYAEHQILQRHIDTLPGRFVFAEVHSADGDPARSRFAYYVNRDYTGRNEHNRVERRYGPNWVRSGGWVFGTLANIRLSQRRVESEPDCIGESDGSGTGTRIRPFIEGEGTIAAEMDLGALGVPGLAGRREVHVVLDSVTPRLLGRARLRQSPEERREPTRDERREAEEAVRRYGGVLEDYLPPIGEFANQRSVGKIPQHTEAGLQYLPMYTAAGLLVVNVLNRIFGQSMPPAVSQTLNALCTAGVPMLVGLQLYRTYRRHGTTPGEIFFQAQGRYDDATYRITMPYGTEEAASEAVAVPKTFVQYISDAVQDALFDLPTVLVGLGSLGAYYALQDSGHEIARNVALSMGVYNGIGLATGDTIFRWASRNPFSGGGITGLEAEVPNESSHQGAEIQGSDFHYDVHQLSPMGVEAFTEQYASAPAGTFDLNTAIVNVPTASGTTTYACQQPGLNGFQLFKQLRDLGTTAMENLLNSGNSGGTTCTQLGPLPPDGIQY